MTTYVLGAGASFHAGFPLCSQLWAAMLKWTNETQDPDSEHRETINAVAAKAGTILDVEQLLTELESGDGSFRDLPDGERRRLVGGIRQCVRASLMTWPRRNGLQRMARTAPSGGPFGAE
jgi:hypothetical protein